MFRRLATPKSLAIIGGIACGAGYLATNNKDVSHMGVVRFARAGATACVTIVDYKLTMRGNLNPDEYQKRMHLCHLRGATRILGLCQKNGGVFIKVGQHLASLQYLLPDEYTSVLGVLHSKAPSSNVEDIKMVFVESTGKKLDDVFDYFNPEPCGAASLAQVHEARLKSGERVAVKIQHPNVRDRSVVDIATMELFVRIADYLFSDFKLMWLVDETKKNLPKELDFLHEAKNAMKVRDMFKHMDFLEIPNVYHELCSEKVLTMQFCDGCQITDVDSLREHNIDSHDVCRKIGHLYSEMIFKDGYIHCDPHPGNILVRRDGKKTKLVLLDHGLYSTLDEDFRVDYCNLWMAILKPDKDEIQKICMKMGVGELFGLFACIVTARSWESLTKGITKVKSTAAETTHIKEFASSLIPQISQVLDRMPRSMLLILKTNDLLRAIEFRLGAQNRSDAFLEMSRQCSRTVFDYRRKRSKSFIDKFVLTAKLYIILCKISLYQMYLRVRELFYGFENLKSQSTSRPLTIVY